MASRFGGPRSLTGFHVWNTGAAFSLFAMVEAAALLLIRHRGSVSIVTDRWILSVPPQGREKSHPRLQVLFFGGAHGNLMNRIFRGYVVDSL